LSTFNSNAKNETVFLCSTVIKREKKKKGNNRKLLRINRKKNIAGKIYRLPTRITSQQNSTINKVDSKRQTKIQSTLNNIKST
jgi:hypothetical protein